MLPRLELAAGRRPRGAEEEDLQREGGPWNRATQSGQGKGGKVGMMAEHARPAPRRPGRGRSEAAARKGQGKVRRKVVPRRGLGIQRRSTEDGVCQSARETTSKQTRSKSVPGMDPQGQLQVVQSARESTRPRWNGSVRVKQAVVSDNVIAGDPSGEAFILRSFLMERFELGPPPKKPRPPPPKTKNDLHQQGVRFLAELWPMCLFSGSDDGVGVLTQLDRDSHRERVVGVFEGHTGALVQACAFGARLLLTGSDDATVRVWDRDDPASAFALEGHSAPITRLLALYQSNEAVSASRDGTLRIWNLPDRSCVRVLADHHGGVCQMELVRRWDGWPLAFSPDGGFKLWDRDQGTLSLEGNIPGFYTSHVLCAEEDFLCVGCDDGAICVFRLKDGPTREIAPAHELRASSHQATVQRTLRHEAQTLLFAGFQNGDISLFNLGAGMCLRSVRAHRGWVMDLRLRRVPATDDVTVASCASNGTVRTCSLLLDDAVRRIPHANCVFRVAFAGPYLYSAGADSLVHRNSLLNVSPPCKPNKLTPA
ncbi:Vegetative incompatibility protein HET-E-1 [Durusdinium trenchii]|uniref:Vegetative incompatibility protein HET-E-1 n=1 Tax=Durusdinium trenchii TaxID=1381693 RepID=A0ABP0MVI8_9DINO